MYRLIGVFILLGLLSGCVTTQEEFQDLALRVQSLENQQALRDQHLKQLEKKILKLQARLSALEKKWPALEKRSQVLEKQSEALAAKRAEILTQIQKLEAELARLQGLYEELAYQQKQDREAFSEFQSEVLKRLASRSKVPAKPPASSPKPEVTENSLYQSALEAFKGKNYELARQKFQEYLRRYPKGKYAPNAYYWIGESYYAERRYEEAILEYQKVIDQFPRSYKVPAALLKQGLAFLRLGDTEAARIIFKKILKEHPKSEQAAVARKYLKRLK